MTNSLRFFESIHVNFQNNMNICCTLVSGSYFIGAASLINSLVAQGFQGEIHVGYTGELPSWWSSENQEVAKGVLVVSVPVETKRFLGYEKPFFMLSVARSRPHCSRLCWFDADVVALAPWSFIEGWVDGGVAICADLGFHEVWPQHPWRREWRRLISHAGLQESDPEQRVSANIYANSGFLGCRAEHFSILQIWASLIQAFEDTGGNTQSFDMSLRWRAVVSDQDLLAAALMCWNGPLLQLGLEGMGFNGVAFPLCHGIENPKPWQIGAVRRALSGADLSNYRRHFEHFLRIGPIVPFDRKALQLRDANFKIATLLSRFYKR